MAWDAGTLLAHADEGVRSSECFWIGRYEKLGRAVETGMHDIGGMNSVQYGFSRYMVYRIRLVVENNSELFRGTKTPSRGRYIRIRVE